MKAIVVGGLTGACVCLILVAVAGAAFCFVQGAGAGYEGAKPPYTLAAAALGALLFVLVGGGPAGIVGLAFGAVVADVRRHRKCVRSRGALPTQFPGRLMWIGVLDIVIGLGPFIFSGLILVTVIHKQVGTEEWLFFLGQVGWFTIGLLMVVMGVRRLCDKYEPFRTTLSLRICCTLGAAALALWGHVYVSGSPSDPSGALKAGAYVLLVGAAVVVLVFLLCSTLYLRRISGQVAVVQGRTNGLS